MSTLIVFELPNTITKNELREAFGQKGNVTNVQLIFNVDSESCYFALITFESEKDARAAFNHFNKANMFSSRIMIELCKEIEDDKTKTENCTIQKTESNDIKLGNNTKDTIPPQSSSNDSASSPVVEGQWNANNPTGKKVYSKSFLIELGNKPVCQKRHEKLKFTDSFVKSTHSSMYSLISSQIVQDFDEKPMDALCANMIQAYELNHNLDTIRDSLVKDTKSVFYNNRALFVKTMSLLTLNRSCSTRKKTGKMFADLFITRIIPVSALTEGMSVIFKNWNYYLDTYPEFFSHMVDVNVPLLISMNSFEFCYLRHVCKSLNSNTASATFFIEVLKRILNSKQVKQHHEGIVWIYKKWRKSEVTLDTFILNNQINKYFTNDRLGIFMLSMALYDKMIVADCKQITNIMNKWIKTNIKQEIIQSPQFIRAFAIAICFISIHNFSKLVPFEKLLEQSLLKLLSCHIRFIENKPLKKLEIQRREVECLYGIQLASATVNNDAAALSAVLRSLYNNKIISRYSFIKWKNENKFEDGFDEDLEIKTKAVLLLRTFFYKLMQDSDEN